MRWGFILTVAFWPAMAMADAQSCSFEQECYATLACTDTDMAVTVDLEAGTVETPSGEVKIVGLYEGPMAKTAVLEGFAGYQLLTMGQTQWILTVHIPAGPAVANYYGECGAE